MKKAQDKMVRSGDVPNKALPTDLPAALVCVRECLCPGVGSFQAGEKVTDPGIIARLLETPYFEKLTEDK